MKKVIYLAVLLAFFAISCKKSDSGNNGTSEPYMTTAAGTTWNYKTKDNKTGADTNSITTSLDRDTNMLNKTYHLYSDKTVETNQTSTSYMSQVGNDYYQLASLSDQLDPFEMKYLSTSANVGESWTNTLNSTTSGATVTATIRNTIMEKGGSLTIGSKTYNNIIKVKTEIASASIQLPLVGNITPTIVQDVQSYFAPKFGLVKRDYKLKLTATIPLQGSLTLTDIDKSTTLTDSSIQ